MSRLILLRAAVPWISSGLLAIGWIALRYGGGDDLELRAMSLAGLLGEAGSIRAIGAMLAGAVALTTAFSLAIAAHRIRAEGRRRLASLLGLLVLPSIAATITSMIGAPRIYFAYAAVPLLGGIAIAIAAAARGDETSRSLAFGTALSLPVAFAALVLGRMLQIEAEALGSLPAAPPDARPQLVLAMLQEMDPLRTLLARALPLLLLPAIALASRRSLALAPIAALPLVLHPATSMVIDEARPAPLGVELVQIPRSGPARIDVVLNDRTEPKPDLHVALPANAPPATLRSFLQRAQGTSIVLVGDATDWIGRISMEEIAARDPSALPFAQAYGALRITTSTAVEYGSAQELVDAFLE